MTAIDTAVRHLAPHEPGYWAAQRDGFAAITELEAALIYDILFHQDIENQLHGALYSWPQTKIDTHVAAITAEINRLAQRAARGHAVLIIRAQQRSDDTAHRILDAYRVLTEPG